MHDFSDIIQLIICDSEIEEWFSYALIVDVGKYDDIK